MNEFNQQHIRGDGPQSAIAVREIGNAADRITTAAQAGAQESAASLRQQADDLQAQLDATARAHGFLDYADMYRRTVEKREPLDKDSKDGLLRDVRHAETLRWMQAMSRPTWLSLKGRR